MKTIDFNIKKKIAAWKLAVKGVSIIPVLYSEQIHNDAIRSNIELWDKNREAVPGRYKMHNSIQTWYDGNTNEFFVYLPHFDSEQELDRVLLEKVTRITGLSGFLGEAAANKAARTLFDGLYPDLQEKLLSESLSLNRDDNNRASAGRHYIASAVEEMTTAPDEKKAFNHWRYIFHNYIERQDPAFWSSLSLDLNLRSNLFAAGLRGFMFNKRENRRISIEGVSAETTREHLEDLHENVVKDEYVDRGEFIRLGQPSPRFISALTYPSTATVELPLSSLFADSDGGYSVRVAKPSEGTKWNRHPIIIKDIANLKYELDEPLATFKSKDSHSPNTTLFMLHVANSLKPTLDNIIVVCSPKTINDDPSLGRIQKRGTGRWVNRIDSIYSKDDFSFILLLAEKGLVNYLEPGFEEKWLKPAIERLDRYYTETFKVSGIEKPSREEIEALRGTFAVFSTSNADVYKNIDRSLAIKRERSGLLSEYATYLVAVESATKVVKEFENPKIITQNRILFNIGEVKEITPTNHALVEEIASRIRNAGIPTHIVPANDPVLSGAIVPSGRKALGYSNGSEIFLSEDGATAETTIHEYTHVWAEAMRIANPSGWNSIKESLKKLPLWDDIHNDTAYRDILQTEDDVASEVLSRYSGLENVKKLLDNPERKGATAAEQVDAAAQMVNEFWGWNGKNLFGIQSFDSVREVTDRILYDLAMETDLTSARELDIAEGEETVSLLTLEERATLSNPRLKELNSEFNRRLAEMKAGTLNPDYTFNLGLPSIYLRSTGIANTNIFLRARTLNIKANDPNHPFSLNELQDLVLAIQKPWVIFRYGNDKKAQNLIVGIENGDKHFLIGLSITPFVKGNYLEINSVRTVFPKDDPEWLKWIQSGKAIRIDEPQKVKAVINKQGINYSAIADLDLSLVANIVEKFDNPKIEDISFDLDENIEFTPTPATRVFNDALGVDGFIVYDDPLTLSYFDKLVQSGEPIQVTLGKVYSDIEAKNSNLPDNCFQIIVSGDGVTERFLMGPGLKLQEQYEDYIAAGLDVPSPFNNHIKYNMENDITSAQTWFKALSFDDLLRCITSFGERIDLSVIPQEKDRVEIQKLHNTISMIGAIPNPEYDHDEDGLGSTTRNVILNVLSSLSADTLSAMRTELSVQVLSDKLSDYMFWAHRHELGNESDPKLIETMKETASRRAFAFTNALHNKVNIQEFVALSEKLDFEKLKATINEQFKDEVDVDIVAAKEDFMSILRLFETSRKSSLIEFNVPKGANGVIGTVNDAAIAALEAYYKNTLAEALLINNNLPSRITEGFKAIAEQSVFAIHLKQGDDVNDFDVVMDFALSLGWLHTGDSILLIDESKPDRYSMEEILIHDANPADPAYETYRQVELDSEKRIIRYISEEDDYRFDAKSGILKAAWSNQIQSLIDLPSAFDKMVKELTPEHLSDMNFLELEGLNLTLDTIIREISANAQLSGVIEPSYERLEEARSSIANSAKAARAEFEQFLERGMRTNNTLIDRLSGNVFKPQYKLPDSYTITKLTLDDELLQHLDSFSYKEAFKAFLKNREINIPIPFDYEANFQEITLEAVDNTTGKTTSLVFINKYNCKSPEVQRSISLILENKNTTVETLAAHDPYESYEIELKHLGKGSFLQLGKDSIRITEEGVYVFRDEQGKLNWMDSEDYSKRFTQINPPISAQSNHREKYATHIMAESAILELDDTALTQLELIGRLEGPLCLDANTLVLVQKDGHHVITLERELATEIVNDLTKDGIVDIDGIKYHVDADNIRQLSIGEGQYLRPVNDYLTPIYTVLDIKEQQLVKSKPFADVYRSHCARLSALEHQKSQELSRSQENTRANSKGRRM